MTKAVLLFSAAAAAVAFSAAAFVVVVAPHVVEVAPHVAEPVIPEAREGARTPSPRPVVISGAVHPPRFTPPLPASSPQDSWPDLEHGGATWPAVFLLGAVVGVLSVIVPRRRS
jgi:hypothetical protein